MYLPNSLNNLNCVILCYLQNLFILWHGSVCRFSALNSYFPVDNKGFGNQGKDCYGVEHNFG